MSYLGYGVFGSPARVLDGGNDLRYRYDAAGRTTFVDGARGGTLRPIKEFRYATTNQGTDLRQGASKGPIVAVTATLSG